MIWIGLFIVIAGAWAIWRMYSTASPKPFRAAHGRADTAGSPGQRQLPMWQLGVLALLLVLGVVAVGGRTSTPSGFGDAQAFQLCQDALTKLSRDPARAEIPWVQDMGSGSEHYYAWGAQTKHMRMRNGFGLDVAVSGSCIVDGTTRRITSLTMDGKSIL
ncbi:hypothetical protein [Ideonella dechloratans]|uniref:hypothetical protein n=1 Tax=Ideonella dechloratans TaxID=36863 RepID=UPI0035B14698